MGHRISPMGSTLIHPTLGYVLQKTKNGWKYQHRLIAATMLGRDLKLGEIVHHRNGKKADNRPDNLTVYGSNAEHMATEHGKRDQLCERCGKSFIDKHYYQICNGKRYPRRFCDRACFIESKKGKQPLSFRKLRAIT